MDRPASPHHLGVQISCGVYPEVFHNLARQKESTFLGANDPCKALKTTLKAEINAEAWASLHSDTSRPFPRPTNGRIAVKVINHLGDEVMKVFRVGAA